MGCLRFLHALMPSGEGWAEFGVMSCKQLHIAFLPDGLRVGEGRSWPNAAIPPRIGLELGC